MACFSLLISTNRNPETEAEELRSCEHGLDYLFFFFFLVIFIQMRRRKKILEDNFIGSKIAISNICVCLCVS